MFLLPRILFNVYWWARFDTLASWVDGFPLLTRPLFVMCLVAFAIVFCLAPLHLPHWGLATHLKSGAKKQVSYHISRTMGDCYTLRVETTLSVIVRKNRAIAKDRGRPFTFMFSQYESYLKRLTTMAFGEVSVRFSSRYHYFEILGPPAT